MSPMELENTDITAVQVESEAVKFIFKQTNYFSRAAKLAIENVEPSAVFEGFDMQFADMIDEIQGKELNHWDGSEKQLKAIIEGKRIIYFELLGKNRIYLLLIKRNRISASWMKVYISFSQVKITKDGIASSGFGLPSWMTDNYYKNAINWMRPLEAQRAALDLLCEIDDARLHEYVMPGTRGDGDKAAVVLIRIGYPRIEGIIDGLLGWLMDMNWPGANAVMELLKTVPDDVLAGHMEKAIDTVVWTNDAIWLYWMFELIYEKQLEDRIMKVICTKQKKEVIKLISALFYELSDDGSYAFEVLKKNGSKYEHDNALSIWVSKIIESAGITEEDIQKERASHV